MPGFLASLVFLGLSAGSMAQGSSFDPAAVASIRAGHHDCLRCRLAHADLTNTCVKHGNLEGADLESAKLVLMCVSFGDYRNASFRGDNFSGANLAHARLDGADLTGARLTITSIKGADLHRAKGSTQAQVDQACGDAETRLPAKLRVKTGS